MTDCTRPGLPSSLSWIVAATHPHQERIACENLDRQGFHVYCPKVRKRVRHARVTREAIRPLFPGYVFILSDLLMQPWRPVLSTRGVRTLIRAGDQPCTLAAAFIEALQAREVDGLIVKPTQPFRLGQKVRLSADTMHGMVATILEMDEKGRLVVLLDMLNRPVRVRVDSRQVAEI